MAIPNNNLVWHTKAIIDQVRFAELKHPDFAKSFASTTTVLPAVQNSLAVARAKSDSEAKEGYSFEATINEEILEALEAQLQGDYQHAYEELAQCGAVIIRAMEWIKQHKVGKHD